jgi:hypothetical protein
VPNLITQGTADTWRFDSDYMDYISHEKVDSTKFYDWVLDVDLIKNVPEKGWKVPPTVLL